MREETLNKDIWLYLKKIEHEIIHNKSCFFTYIVKDDKHAKNEIRNLRKLESMGCIKMSVPPKPHLTSIQELGSTKDTKKYLIPIRILEQKFKEVCAYYKKQEDVEWLPKKKDEFVESIQICNVKYSTKIYINKNYDDKAIEPRDTRSKDKENSSWEVIIKLGKKEQVSYNLDTKKYFNSNLNNPIYKLGYRRTKILADKKLGKYKYFSSLIPIEIITQETINRSVGQKNTKQ